MIRVGIWMISIVVFAWHAWQDTHPPTYIVLNHPHLEAQTFAKFLSKYHAGQEKVLDWIKTEPWTLSATINKVDGSTYIIDVNERHPIAQWQHGAMVDERGDIFFPMVKHFDSKLPTIQVQASSVKEGAQLVKVLSPVLKQIKGYPLTVFKKEPGGDWVVSLASNRYLIFGTMDLTKRLQVAELVVKRLHDHHEPWGRIDFRYNNGFAISKNPLHEPFHWPMIQLSYG